MGDMDAFLVKERAKRNQKEILGYFEDLANKKVIPGQLGTPNIECTGFDEEDEDFVKLLNMKPEKFSTSRDYIKSFVSQMKKINRADHENEAQRKDTLSFNFITQNQQPTAFRKPIDTTKCFVKAMVPVLTETFEAEFNGTKRPTYNKVGEEWLKN